MNGQTHAPITAPSANAILAFILSRPGTTVPQVIAALDTSGEQSDSNSTPTAPVLLTTKEAANRLRVCKRTLWNLARRGELRLVKVGARTRIPLTEIERIANGGC